MENLSSETSWNLYTTNEQGWEAMLAACEAAQETIDLEQFIFITDNIGKRFIEVCARRAQAGVRVRFLWDAAGSFSFFGSSIVEELQSKKIELVFFNTLFPSFLKFHNYRSWYFRNHKRTLVVDNKIGFTGSICISDEMIKWHDTVAKVEGPVVKSMSIEFQRTWNRAHGKKISRKVYERLDEIREENISKEFRYVTNYPFPRQHKLYKEVIRALRDAQKYVYITTPYFVPTRHLSRALRSAARRGVDLKLIIPEWSDHTLVDLCGQSFFTQMLKAGVKIHLYKGEMMHRKTMVIDGVWSTVGTLNLDTASLMYNFEASIVTTNSRFAQELNDHFMNDMLDTREINLADWKNRYWVLKLSAWCMRLFRDFL